MTTVTGLTADRMLDIEAASVVDGDIVGDNLILTKHDGTQINAGSVVGPPGPQGPVGSMLDVISAKPILEVGLANQIRAGRQLSSADFGNMGLNAPLGLWNLSDLTDVSGNGRNLLNKGGVPFGIGINGLASTAAVFSGSTAQALYIADTGANDPFRLKTGSFGVWFRTAKRNASFQVILSKRSVASPQLGIQLCITGTALATYISQSGVTWDSTVLGSSNVSDDRWHFAVVTFDGSTNRLYLDGILEAAQAYNFVVNVGPYPLNIGSFAADGSTPAGDPFFGCIDEAFITNDILTEDQIYNLYCAKIPHTLSALPSRVTLNVRRCRRGPAITVADFPTQPVRLYNFSAGSLGDEGSNNVGLTARPSTGSIMPVPGVDGTPNNAYSFLGANSGLASTDTGLPAGTTPRSYGMWFKISTMAGNYVLISYGASVGSNDIRIFSQTSGVLALANGSDSIDHSTHTADGRWHFIVVVEDNAAIDGLKRKAYIDGRLVGHSSGLQSVTLGGANKFCIGAHSDGSTPWSGQIDGVFICNYTLRIDQIAALYAKGSQILAPSPKNAGDHIEALTVTDLLATFATLDNVHQVDLKVAS